MESCYLSYCSLKSVTDYLDLKSGALKGVFCCTSEVGLAIPVKEEVEDLPPRSSTVCVADLPWDPREPDFSRFSHTAVWLCCLLFLIRIHFNY